MIRGLILFVLIVTSIYIAVMHGIRRFVAMAQAPESMRADLQYWGTVYLSIGSLLFAAACTLGFYWLAKKLQNSKN